MNLYYVIDCHTTTGHAGRYPAPIARIVARILVRFTGRRGWDISPTVEGY